MIVFDHRRENESGADNQQGRIAIAKAMVVTLRDYTPDYLGRKTKVDLSTEASAKMEDIVRTAWRHAEVGRNAYPLRIESM